MRSHINTSQPSWLPRTAPILSLLGLLASGCATGFGAKALRSERPDWNQQIARSGDAEMLLNLVRLRYNDSPLFLELGAVVAQYGYDASFNATGQIEAGASNATLGTGLGYSEHPTVTYTPLSGEDFAERMLSPISLDSLMLFEQAGWSAERLFLLAVQRVNDVFNARSATGPTPSRKPDYETFADFAERFERLRVAGLIGLNWEKKEHETDAPGRNPRFWLRSPQDPNSHFMEDLAIVRRYLALEARQNDFRLTAFPFNRQPNEVGIRCRSMLGILYFLSQAVELPADHVRAGLGTMTEDDGGQPFDWSKVTAKVMTIRSQKDHPGNAYIAVQHRGFWFYIADDDQTSKETFSLVKILLSLQSAVEKGKSPLLTLPVGK